MDMKTAVYTTLYPDAIRFWSDFIQSVEAQIDQDFDLVVCLDGVSADDVNSGRLIHFYLPSTKTPSSIRQETWQHLIDNGYEAIIMVDADDVLMPDRVKNARAGLVNADMDVCGLQLVGKDLKKMDWTLQPDPDEPTENYIIQANDIGLSNTAYRAECLQRLIPAPDDIVMLDWFLALRAVEEGAKIDKRPDLDMLYRQYDGNVANFIPPYTEEMIKTQTARVIAFWESAVPHLSKLQPKAKERLEVVIESFNLINKKYIENLNLMKEKPKWWHMVAKR